MLLATLRYSPIRYALMFYVRDTRHFCHDALRFMSATPPPCRLRWRVTIIVSLMPFAASIRYATSDIMVCHIADAYHATHTPLCRVYAIHADADADAYGCAMARVAAADAAAPRRCCCQLLMPRVYATDGGALTPCAARAATAATLLICTLCLRIRCFD